MRKVLDAEDRAEVFVEHRFAEHRVDLGEVRMNYAETGAPSKPALLFIPGQGGSWWSYETLMEQLSDSFNVFAIDLRGQGRSTWTPGRYTTDNIANDVVRFIDAVIGRPVIVSGQSSGGVVAAWLAAFAKPGQVRAALLEDPPLFAGEITPAVGPSLRQGIGPVFERRSRYLGNQWSIGDWEGYVRSVRTELPSWMSALVTDVPSQSMREYDPEWATACVTGTMGSCDHELLLSAVRVPILFTHHFHMVDEHGHLMGASTDQQAAAVCRLVEQAGQPIDYRPFPDAAHNLHSTNPALFAATLTDWATRL